jgi:hypothetical protein
VLYARCGFCAGVAPLWCSGRFMPHVPVYVEATPMGAACSVCGVLPPAFGCMFCGTQQFLLLAGAPNPGLALPGRSQNYAAVIQAPPNASESVLSKGFSKFMSNVGSEFGKGVVQAMFGPQQQ